jgi:hypothetical protein
MIPSTASHWERIWRSHKPGEVTWFEVEPAT